MGPGEGSQALQGSGLGWGQGLGWALAASNRSPSRCSLFPATFSSLTDAFLPFQVLPPQELS